MSDKQLPITTHLEELRKRLMISAGAWLVAFLACYGFAEQLFQLLPAAVPRGQGRGAVDAEFDLHLRCTGAKPKFDLSGPVGDAVGDNLLGG